jgi:hypothetical protein
MGFLAAGFLALTARFGALAVFALVFRTAAFLAGFFADFAFALVFLRAAGFAAAFFFVFTAAALGAFLPFVFFAFFDLVDFAIMSSCLPCHALPHRQRQRAHESGSLRRYQTLAARLRRPPSILLITLPPANVADLISLPPMTALAPI